MTAARRGHGAAWLIHAEVHMQALDLVFVGGILGLAFDAFDLQVSVYSHFVLRCSLSKWMILARLYLNNFG